MMSETPHSKASDAKGKDRFLRYIRPWIVALFGALASFAFIFVPFFGIIASLFAPLTITGFVYAAALLLVVDVWRRRTHWVFLAPLGLACGLWVAVLIHSHNEIAELTRRVERMQSGDVIGFDPTRNALVGDQTAGVMNELQARYQLEMYYAPQSSGAAATIASYRVVLGRACTWRFDPHSHAGEMALGSGGYGGPEIEVRNACVVFGPEPPMLPPIRMRTEAWTEDSDRIGFSRTVIEREGQATNAVTASILAPSLLPLINFSCFKECRFDWGDGLVRIPGDHVALVAQKLGLHPRHFINRRPFDWHADIAP